MSINQKIIDRLPSEDTHMFVERVTEEANDIVTCVSTIGNPPKEHRYPRNDVHIINISYLDTETAIIVYKSN